MKPANPHILTINGGSSSIKFALFESGDSLQRILEGGIERIGLPAASLQVKSLNPADNFSRLVSAPDHTAAVDALMDWIEEQMFAGGMGENAPTVRARICDGLGFLGIELEAKRNAANEDVISAQTSRVPVRVIHTDEALMIARLVCHTLGLG
jgi:acetate kinase